MEFEQFRCTPVSLEIAARLIGGDSNTLIELREGRLVTEALLSTCAKLVWTGQEFAVFSYAHDGSDGRKAVEEVS